MNNSTMLPAAAISQNPVQGDLLHLAFTFAAGAVVYGVTAVLAFLCSLGIVLYCYYLGAAACKMFRNSRLGEETASKAGRSLPNNEKVGLVCCSATLPALFDFCYIMITKDDWESTTWTQHAWNLLKAIMLVTFGELVMSTTVIGCVALVVAMIIGVHSGCQAFSGWRQRPKAYKVVRESEEEGLGLEAGVERK